MEKHYLRDQNRALNELQFTVLGALCDGRINCIFDKLMISGLDDVSLGFWVWDIPGDKERFSPGFRAALQFIGLEDFPDDPKSWQKAIIPEYLPLVFSNFEKHIATKGEASYHQKVVYKRKYSGTLTLICHGIVVKWDGDKPLTMVGVHLPESGLFIENKIPK